MYLRSLSLSVCKVKSQMEHKHKCCNKQKVKKGTWSIEEDEILSNYVTHHDDFQWRSIPELTGLKRCGKDCRLRWLNYLRPDLKHGDFSEEEANIVFTVYKSFGNKWTKIARFLPGRTDNEIKNFWNKNQKKKKKKTSLSRKNNFPTSFAIDPIYILESSDHSTTFNHSSNIDSSKSLLYDTTMVSGGFQPNPIIYPNLNQPPPLNLSYNHDYLPLGTSSIHGQPLFNPSLMPSSSWVGSNIPSYINNTSSIPQCGWINPTPLSDPNKLMCSMIHISSIPLSGWTNLNLSNNAKSFPPVNHMASTSVSATGNDPTNASRGQKDVFDINEFFDFDRFCTIHDRATSSEEEGQEESLHDHKPTNEY